MSNKSNYLRPSGERLRGEERDRRLGDGDLLLRGERLILRREDDLGLFSRDLSLPGPASARGRFLVKHRGQGENDISNLAVKDVKCSFH